ncbi:lupus La protein [Pancytospora philotis]|nr:lupus La protein [Pancytospora philotis]KAI4292293.1 lupus La protein [Pancytospora philotis]
MDAGKIKEQIEFYFSDSNYARDAFMQQTAAQNDKCIPITTLLSFQRLKKLGATVEAVKEAAAGLAVVEVVDDSLRKVETSAYLEYRADKEIAKRVVHMSGFAADAELDDIQSILREHCKPVKVTMRRNKDKSFAGSCLVEFATAEEAKDALELKIEQGAPADAGEIAEEETKKSKTEPAYLKIVSKEAYQETAPAKKDTSNERFADKVKADFIPKLYVYETATPLSIADIKALVPNVAFVDTTAKIVRMKFREEWTEKEAGSGDKKITLTKMGEEDAKKYVAGLNIKKLPKKK